MGVINQGLTDSKDNMTGGESPADNPSNSGTSLLECRGVTRQDKMEQAIGNLESVFGERFRSGFAVNDHAWIYCLAAFNDYCALKRTPNEESRTKLRGRLAQNCGVLRNAGVAGKISYCR